MAKLFEINEHIAVLRDFNVDPETGEMLDMSDEDIAEMIGVLQLDRIEKLEGCAVIAKEMRADAAAFKAEADRLTKCAKACERRAESLVSYMKENMEYGEKPDTMKFKATWRRSVVTVVDDIGSLPPEYLRYKDPEADKKAIKAAIEGEGVTVPGAHLEESVSLSIR